MRRNLIVLGIILAAVFVIWFQQNNGNPPIPRAGGVTGNAADFGKVFVGGTAKRDITWTNNTGNDLTFTTAGTNGDPFGTDAAAMPAAGAAFRKNGGTLVVKYTFSPTAKGVFNGRANIITQGGAAQVTRPDLTGEGIYSANSGVFRVSLPGAPAPEFIDFGRVVIGTTPSPTKIANVTNASPAAVNANATTNDPAFTTTPANPVALAPSAQTPVTVTFTPTQRKVYWAILLVQDPTNPGNHTIVVVTGEGIAGG